MSTICFNCPPCGAQCSFMATKYIVWEFNLDKCCIFSFLIKVFPTINYIMIRMTDWARPCACDLLQCDFDTPYFTICLVAIERKKKHSHTIAIFSVTFQLKMIALTYLLLMLLRLLLWIKEMKSKQSNASK